MKGDDVSTDTTVLADSSPDRAPDTREAPDTKEDRQASASPFRNRTAPEISIVVPTYNERENIRPLVAAIAAAFGDTPWELIFVDDDSPDGTYREILAVAAAGAPVRCLRRVGRRGLASAVVEGAMSASAEIVGVIDADMQHDETLLVRMLDRMQTTDTDVVVASRHVEGGGLGDWSASRRRMSAFATWASRLLIGNTISDPMSGFFMTRRSVFDAAIYDLSQQGYKILLDILTSSPHPLKVTELPYVFRERLSGESKVDVMIIVEFAFLLIEKFSRGLIPPRFVLFSCVGGLGLIAHVAVLKLMMALGFVFLTSQIVATLCAMTFNYAVNNSITYRSERLRGRRFAIGYLVFCVVCSMGAIANIGVADMTISHTHSWPLAGIAGALMSAVFNFGVATRFIWGRPRRREQPRMVVQSA
jgi:dolichol-phosphate mannosyltransferase